MLQPSVRTALRAVLGRVSHASVPELLRLPHLKLNLNLRPIPHIPDPISYAPALGTDGSPSRPRTRGSRVRTRTPPPPHLKLNLNLKLIPHPSSSSHQPSRTWRPWREVFFSPKKNGLKAFDLQPVSQKRCPLWSHHLKANKLPVRPIWYCAG